GWTLATRRSSRNTSRIHPNDSHPGSRDKHATACRSLSSDQDSRKKLMTRHHHASRRRFLSAAAATLVIPTILPRSVFGANERITTGHIGVGNQGTNNLTAFVKYAAAVCDVDSKRLAGAARLLELAGVASPGTFRDYRALLDRNDIDAVVITT